MIRKLLATTALATLVATGALAQEAPAPAPADPAQPAQMEQEAAPVVKAEGNLATQIIGENVYNSTSEDAEHVGDVNDIVIGTDGKIEAVVVGVGGFLGIGEKEVALDFATLEWAERDGDRWLVAQMTKEQLEQQTAFDRNAYQPEQTTAATEPAATGVAPAPDSTVQAPAEQPAPETSAQAPAEPAPDATAEAPAEPVPDATAEAPAEPAPATTAEAPADSATDTTTTAAIDRSTLKEMPAAEIRAEEMIGTTVYGADDANVGEIGDIVLTSDGKIDAYVVDVGGFLGMGEKEVAIGSDNLAFMVDDQGNKYLYTTFTKEQLDAAPAYDKSTYTEKRDEQRILVQ
jgi:sporulation protein YlmC with PRC-barrel domain